MITFPFLNARCSVLGQSAHRADAFSASVAVQSAQDFQQLSLMTSMTLTMKGLVFTLEIFAAHFETRTVAICLHRADGVADETLECKG